MKALFYSYFIAIRFIDRLIIISLLRYRGFFVP